MKNHVVSDNNCNVVSFLMPTSIYKGWQILLGLRLELVTLHRQFTISSEH